MKSINTDRLLGIYEKAINEKFSLEEKIKIAKKANFDFMEFSVDETDKKLARLNWTKNQIKKVQLLLIENDFTFNSMTLSGLRKYPFGSHEPNIRKTSRNIIKKAILLAKKLNIRTIQMAGYDVYYEKSDNQTLKYFYQNLKYALKLAAKYSVMLSFEVMDTEFMGLNSRIMPWIEKLNSPYITIYPDLGNIYQWCKKENLEKEFLLAKNKIVAFHFKDTLPGKFRDIEFGQGSVDFNYLLKIIKKHKLNQPMMIEMWSKNNPEETFNQAVEKIAKARDFYYQKWNEVNKNK